MATKTIGTAAGNLELTPAGIDQLRGVARYWPMELLAAGAQGPFGLVFQHGQEEMHGVKRQPVDVSEADAMPIHHMNRSLIAAALPHYLEKEHQGVMLPCAYYRKKQDGMAETGIAFFVGPDPTSESATPAAASALFDARLGHGATAMVTDMLNALARASDESDLLLMKPIGMDLRPRLAIGGLAMHFIVEGSRVFVIKDQLHEAEPVWEYVVRAGFSELPYAPMRPAALPAEAPRTTEP